MEELPIERSGSGGASGPSVQEEWGTIRARVLAVGLVALVAFFAAFLFGLSRHGDSLAATVMIVVTVFIFILAGVSLFMYRCPACGGYPGRSFWWYPRHCQNCGVFLG